MARSLDTGAPAAEALTRLADDLRRERRTLADQAARSVGVRAAAPLGLCFLPAFVLVGIVPSIVSAFGALRLF
jgi:pilus assembly protein TadC